MLLACRSPILASHKLNRSDSAVASPQGREQVISQIKAKDRPTDIDSFALGAITSYLRSRLITILGDELTAQVAASDVHARWVCEWLVS